MSTLMTEGLETIDRTWTLATVWTGRDRPVSSSDDHVFAVRARYAKTYYRTSSPGSFVHEQTNVKETARRYFDDDGCPFDQSRIYQLVPR